MLLLQNWIRFKLAIWKCSNQAKLDLAHVEFQRQFEYVVNALHAVVLSSLRMWWSYVICGVAHMACTMFLVLLQIYIAALSWSNSQRAMARQLPNFSRGVFPVSLHDFTETMSRRRHILITSCCALSGAVIILIYILQFLWSLQIVVNRLKGCKILVGRDWWLSSILYGSFTRMLHNGKHKFIL
jgi:hypothetical protein